MGTLRPGEWHRAPARCVIRGCVLAMCCMVGCFAWWDDTSAQSACDPALIQRDTRPLSYRARGPRCEGIYRRRVASFGVQLVSFTAASELTDLCSGDRAVRLTVPRVAFTLSGAPSIHIQAESLRPLLYYRLDVDVGSAEPEYEWPWDPRCSAEVRLTAQELGVTARAPVRLGASEVEALVPVRLSLSAQPVRPPYRALLMPGRRVREVFVSLWHYGGGAAPERRVSERPVNARPYPAETPIAVLFEAGEVPKGGLYRARLNVEFDGGPVEAIDFYFIAAP